MQNPPKKLSPMMAQWYRCKQQAKEALLLFRLGDFYEAFYEDAVILSQQLDLTLTHRQGIPMSGIPAHTCTSYIEKLVAKGFLIAVAEQTENPSTEKGLIKREIVEIISPGTLVSESFLKAKTNNFFACIFESNGEFALSLLDLSTGEFRGLEINGIEQLQDQLFAKRPSEVLLSPATAEKLEKTFTQLQQEFPIRLEIEKNLLKEKKESLDLLALHIGKEKMQSYTPDPPLACYAAAALLKQMNESRGLSTSHVHTFTFERLSSYMGIDQTTQRNLELVSPIHAGDERSTLLHLLDQTKTPMGGRLLQNILLRPLLSAQKIQKRQEVIKELLANQENASSIIHILTKISDLERLTTRIGRRNPSPRDCMRLYKSLSQIPLLLEKLRQFHSFLLKEIANSFPDFSPLVEEVQQTLIDPPPFKLGEAPLIKRGIDPTLDRLRGIKENGQSWIANYQQQLKHQMGIKTLKVIYSRAFGYCIEVSRSQAHLLSKEFERRQTLVNTERFTSSPLKEYEENILTAEEKIAQIEKERYEALCQKITSHAKEIQQASRSIARLDCFCALMEVASNFHYTCPMVDESGHIEIEGGRHPVLEAILGEHTFIPNDTKMSPDSLFYLLTGPNMGGKSTYIRQVGIIAILTQIGSFVPAKRARMGLVDYLFSRTGASDNLSQGQSTFMVEMTETAYILAKATPRSLVILDEVGRGTSTFDGIAIAFSVAKYLITLGGLGVKTLFATHYLELTCLQNYFSKVVNLTVAIEESPSKEITLLHKILPGSADKSYGIHVAKLAGFPTSVLEEAQKILSDLEKTKTKEFDPLQNNYSSRPKQEKKPNPSPPLPSHITPLAKELKTIDLEKTTPIEALHILMRWQEIALSKEKSTY